MKINRQDFLNALEEVSLAYGVSKEELEQVVQSGIICSSQNINSILEESRLFVEQVRKSENFTRVSLNPWTP